MRTPIAVVGMACRFPGGDGLESFWELLRGGRSAIREVPADRWNPDEREDGERPEAGAAAVRWGGFLDGVDRFDAEFFRIAPVEARLLDPQQRLMLELSWRALEDAGIAPDSLRGARAGVYAGVWNSDYRDLVVRAEEADSMFLATGSSASTASGRVAFTLGLEGPAMSIDTSSSSSLVAVHQAVLSLRQGETDLALAGGVNAILTPTVTEAFHGAGLLAADGRCRAFDAAADGFVRAEGCGMVVLKRLAKARADGDRIWGVIRGSAVNQDGASVGLTMPSGAAQEALLRAALEDAGIEPAAVDYLEAHGTGTALGDRTEARAAGAAYGQGRAAHRPLLIGSVKTGIGHLEAAAGIAGFIKAVLAMQRGVIPQHLHFETPNPEIAWERLGLEVTAGETEWPRRQGEPPRAGVSSFGFSGTNAHVLIEGPAGEGGDTTTDLAPPVAVALPETLARRFPAAPGPLPRTVRLLPLSAKSPAALGELAERYLERLPSLEASLPSERRGERLADLAWTAGIGRSHFDFRAAIVFRDAERLRTGLERCRAAGDHPRTAAAGKVAFVFTGQGSQWVGMGRAFYDHEPVARAVLDRCDAAMRELRGASLLDVMFGSPGARGVLSETTWLQPALYALESALLYWWESLGIRPEVVLGHSLGELAGVHAAGGYDLETGLRFAAARGALLGGLPTSGPRAGAMAAVFASPDLLLPVLARINQKQSGVPLAIAADNGAHRVISGPEAKVEIVSEVLTESGIRVVRLHTDQAFHSGLLDPVLEDLESLAPDGVSPSSDVTFVSSLTGRAIAPDEVLDGPYWRRQAREPVAFAAAVATLAQHGVDTVVELGPHGVLGTMTQMCWPSSEARPRLVTSMRRPAADDDGEATAEGPMGAAAEAFAAGLPLSFEGLFSGETRRRIALPGVPFQRRRHWIDTATRARARRITGPAPLAAAVRDAAIPDAADPDAADGGAPATSVLLEQLRLAPASRRLELLTTFLRQEVRDILRTPELPDAGMGFFDLGMDSPMAVTLSNRIRGAFGAIYDPPPTVAFDFPDANRLGRHLLDRCGPTGTADPAPRVRRTAGGDEAIAIVGMACRFPGGEDLESFWAQLAAGGDAVSPVPPGRWGPGDGDPAPPAAQWGAFLDGLELFDARFFRIAAVEARLLDPQQRLLLETAWRALEDAGLDPYRLRGASAGVYAGIFTSDYRELVLANRRDAGRHLPTGTSASTAVGRVAYTLGMTGPAVAIDTACSSSLVAVHQAVAGLRRGEADLALAGGVNAILTPTFTNAFAEAGMLSPDGRCKTFDAAADGFVRGEGCGVVALQRLSDALAAGNRVHAILRGSAVNQDGASAGLTVPNGAAQERVLGAALADAGIEPAEVDYLEAHGTGTPLGDPIEVGAAAAVYGAGRSADRPLLIGSVKTNIGHLEAAAGIAGLIKVALSLGRGVIPPHLHFETPNPRIAWRDLPVRVTAAATPWPRSVGRPHRAGVSSFGFSGTNAHVVVEGSEAPPPTRTVALPVLPALGAVDVRAPDARPLRLLPLSGTSAAAARELGRRYLAWLAERRPAAGEDGAWLADLAWSASTGRSRFRHRAGVLFADPPELEEALRRHVRSEAVGQTRDGADVAFVFPGQGREWAGMGQALHATEPVVRAVLDHCDAVVRQRLGASLLDVMFGREAAEGSLSDTAWAQPALFALECALAAWWNSLGIWPVAVLGQGVGEIAAACAAGVFDIETGLRFAAERGALLARLAGPGSSPGGMAAVFASGDRVRGMLEALNAGRDEGALEVAGDNGAHRVVSGPADAVSELLSRCAASGIRAVDLRVGTAFHSSGVAPVLDDLEACAASGSPSGEAALLSSVTGREVPAGTVLDGAYWRRQAREPGAFAAGVRTLAALGADAVIEMGPHGVLGPLAAACWPEPESAPAVIVSLAQPEAMESRRGSVMPAVAAAWEAGLPLLLEGLFAGETRRRIALPGYPFQRRRYWIEPDARRRRGAPNA